LDIVGIYIMFESVLVGIETAASQITGRTSPSTRPGILDIEQWFVSKLDIFAAISKFISYYQNRI